MLYKGGLQLCIWLESLGPSKTISLDLPLNLSNFEGKKLIFVIRNSQLGIIVRLLKLLAYVKIICTRQKFFFFFFVSRSVIISLFGSMKSCTFSDQVVTLSQKLTYALSHTLWTIANTVKLACV